MTTTVLEQRIRASIEPSLSAMGYAIVQLRLHEGPKRKVLQIMAERADDKSMTIDDCADISNTVSALLDVEDPITSAYQLEVSSPGIDRPLHTAEDFKRFLGHEAKVEVNMPMEGRKRFRGAIKEVTKDHVALAVDGEVYTIALDNMRGAKLILTDALIEATIKKQAS